MSLSVLDIDIILNLTYVCRSSNVMERIFLGSLKSFFDDNVYMNLNIFCGDINVDLNKLNVNSVSYQNILSFYGFKSCINISIRINIMNGPSTCIDHIFLKNDVF